MSTQVKFNRNVNFIGRNGAFKCIGLEIANIQGVIVIEPITSKGQVGRCQIEIPQESVNEVVNAITTQETKS